MKKNNKYKIQNLKLKLISIGTILTMIASSLKIADNNEKLTASQNSYDALVEKYFSLLLEYKKLNQSINNDNVMVEENKEITDVIEVGGRNIYVVNQPENSDVTPLLEQNDEIFDYENGFYLEENSIEIEDDNIVDMDFETIDEMIYFYSRVFELNSNVISDKIYELINSNSYAWEYGYSINNVSYNNVEQAIARTIYNIEQNPEDFNLTEEEITSSLEYQLEEYTPEELMYKFSTTLEVNPYLTLAIAYAESGRALNSTNFLNNNNVGGIVGSNGYVHYQNQAEGLFKYVIMLKDNYGCSLESGSEKINSMASNYCELPDHWISLVGGIFSELNNNGYDYIYNNNHSDARSLVLTENELSKDFILVRR